MKSLTNKQGLTGKSMVVKKGPALVRCSTGSVADSVGAKIRIISESTNFFAKILLRYTKNMLFIQLIHGNLLPL
jgi:hypothetical protein